MKLEIESHQRLVLIVAPSGSGKTEYLQRWFQNHLATTSYPPLWFEIKAEHNHPMQFLNRLFSELIKWDPSIVDHSELLQVEVPTQPAKVSPEFESIPGLTPTIEAALTGLINGLVHLDRDRFLLLVNYHHVHDAQIHKMIAYLIDYLPPNFHLIITSQVNPPLQIPRLRARRELLEIGPEDLL